MSSNRVLGSEYDDERLYEDEQLEIYQWGLIEPVYQLLTFLTMVIIVVEIICFPVLIKWVKWDISIIILFSALLGWTLLAFILFY